MPSWVCGGSIGDRPWGGVRVCAGGVPGGGGQGHLDVSSRPHGWGWNGPFAGRGGRPLPGRATLSGRALRGPTRNLGRLIVRGGRVPEPRLPRTSDLELGMVTVNEYPITFPQTPFASAKSSGVGMEQSVHAIGYYTRIKNVNVKPDGVGPRARLHGPALLTPFPRRRPVNINDRRRNLLDARPTVHALPAPRNGNRPHRTIVLQAI